MTNLTTLETEVLRAIANNDFMDGLTGEAAIGKEIWADCIYQNTAIVSSTQLPGVVASLSKKGLIYCSGSGRDATIHMTESGVQAFWN